MTALKGAFVMLCPDAATWWGTFTATAAHAVRNIIDNDGEPLRITWTLDGDDTVHEGTVTAVEGAWTFVFADGRRLNLDEAGVNGLAIP